MAMPMAGDVPSPDLVSIERAVATIWDVATGMGLDPFPTHFELVPASMMYELGAYGIPGRFSHWTHGKAYYHMKTMYDYGLSKIYELVINTNPSQAFLMEANSLLENKMVIAHVLAHTDFFKNNVYFAHTSRQMVESAAAASDRLARYEFEHGMLAVEHFLDAVLALKEHVGGFPGWTPAVARRATRARPQRQPAPPDALSVDTYDDLFAPPAPPEKQQPQRLPAQPERDVLGFLMAQTPDLEEWQRDCLGIVRQEMLYFVPQMQTKIINEGWASFWHQRIMNQLEITPGEHTQFSTLHAGVVSPGGRMHLNPYYVGYRIFQDIERRWGDPHDQHPVKALDKLLEVREMENDQSFLRKYLTEDLVRSLDLYTYRLVDDEWQVVETDWERVRDTLVRSLDHFGLPVVTIDDADYHQSRELLLRHHYDGTELDLRYAEKTLQHLYTIWRRPIHLDTKIDDQAVRLTYDGKRNSKAVI